MIQDPEDRGGLLTSLHALFATAEGDRGRADEWIRKTVTEAKGYLHFHHSAYIVGSAYARMKKPDSALRYLQWAADDGFPCYPLFEKDPSLDNIRFLDSGTSWPGRGNSGSTSRPSFSDQVEESRAPVGQVHP